MKDTKARLMHAAGSEGIDEITVARHNFLHNRIAQILHSATAISQCFFRFLMFFNTKIANGCHVNYQ